MYIKLCLYLDLSPCEDLVKIRSHTVFLRSLYRTTGPQFCEQKCTVRIKKLRCMTQLHTY